MGIRYSELPKTNEPTPDDLIALLDIETSTLRTSTLDEAVNATLGSSDISGIGDGSVKGAISYIYDKGTIKIYRMTQVQYDSLTSAEKNDGNLRVVT